ncbi:MAG: hypothetical protein R3B72_52190, partial [Polyangiaceae bacterium]
DDLEALRRWRVSPKGDSFISFEVSEGHANWPEIKAWLAERQPVDITRTTFTKKELREAAWLTLTGSWHHGYPQPDDDFGFLEETYDTADHCQVCGLGLVQNAPFRMVGEPSWGKHDLLQLHWVPDEFFTKPDVWQEVFAPLGVQRLPVVGLDGVELATVVQLVAAEQRLTANVEGLEHTVCSVCGRTKYAPVTRGMFPAQTWSLKQHYAKTLQGFGSGASGWHATVASQKLAQAILDSRLRGVALRPVV